jgi:hypothetical protein
MVKASREHRVAIENVETDAYANVNRRVDLSDDLSDDLSVD